MAPFCLICEMGLFHRLPLWAALRVKQGARSVFGSGPGLRGFCVEPSLSLDVRGCSGGGGVIPILQMGKLRPEGLPRGT